MAAGKGIEGTAAIVSACAVAAYALLAGCYTLRNFDLGWQLAAGRYMALTGHIPRADIFSYTAAGKPWIYPAGSQFLLYGLYRAGGYAGLTVLGMLACLAIAVVILACTRTGRSWQPGFATPYLLLLAMPAIAARSSARADVFTVVLFAATLGQLWRFRAGQARRLYPLVFLFLAWANLHQGFIFGLALFPVFALALAVEGVLGSRPRTEAWRDAGRLAAWGFVCGLAVLANPWDWRIYASLFQVSRDMAFQQGLIGEASRIPIGWWRLRDVIRLDDPDAGIWLLALLALLGAGLSLWRRQIAPALLLVLALLLGLRYARAQVLFAITACVVLPTALAAGRNFGLRLRTSRTAIAGLAFLLLFVAAFRSYGLITSRYYIERADTASFGFGPSWWFPERAIDFIARERLPGRLYHDYNLGGWVMWRLWPGYAVFSDGRAQPFMPQPFLDQQALSALPPDSPSWKAFLDRWQIGTVLISLARYGGYRIAPAVLCASPEFRLVYMDEVSGVWVRATPANQPWIARLARSCDAEGFTPPGGSAADRYNFYANAGQLQYALSRDDEAWRSYQQAAAILPGDPNLRLSIAQMYQARGLVNEARQQYVEALARSDSGSAWHALGLLEFGQGRYEEAAADFRRAAVRSVLPHESYRMLGEAYLALKDPARALEAFDRAREASRLRDQRAPLVQRFLDAVADGERRARAMAGTQ